MNAKQIVLLSAIAPELQSVAFVEALTELVNAPSYPARQGIVIDYAEGLVKELTRHDTDYAALQSASEAEGRDDIPF